ncbi:MAG: glycosyltransferase [Flavobacteriales bacterium]|nr:glycosyltransferase [Flavobacteriales bacterium]
MNTPIVSVIIPVYNTENYLREAIYSIENQSLTDIEIIAVNDGSTDSSLSILNEMAEKDPRIKVLSQKNAGQSTARNTGFDIATGRYVYFMDSDDILEHTALEKCFAKCEENNLDVVTFDALTFGKSGYFDDNHYKRCHLLKDTIYTGNELLNILMDIQKLRVPMWLYVVKRSFLLDISLRSYPGKRHEDELFTALLFLQAKRVGIINEPFFHRRMRENSTMTTSFAFANLQSYFNVTNALLSFSKTKTKEIKDTADRFLTRMLRAAIWKAHLLPYSQRIKAVWIAVTKYHKYIDTKTLAVALFKRK